MKNYIFIRFVFTSSQLFQLLQNRHDNLFEFLTSFETRHPIEIDLTKVVIVCLAAWLSASLAVCLTHCLGGLNLISQTVQDPSLVNHSFIFKFALNFKLALITYRIAYRIGVK